MVPAPSEEVGAGRAIGEGKSNYYYEFHHYQKHHPELHHPSHE